MQKSIWINPLNELLGEIWYKPNKGGLCWEQVCTHCYDRYCVHSVRMFQLSSFCISVVVQCYLMCKLAVTLTVKFLTKRLFLHIAILIYSKWRDAVGHNPLTFCRVKKNYIFKNIYGFIFSDVNRIAKTILTLWDILFLFLLWLPVIYVYSWAFMSRFPLYALIDRGVDIAASLFLWEEMIILWVSSAVKFISDVISFDWCHLPNISL